MATTTKTTAKKVTPKKVVVKPKAVEPKVVEQPKEEKTVVVITKGDIIRTYNTNNTKIIKMCMRNDKLIRNLIAFNKNKQNERFEEAKVEIDNNNKKIIELLND